MNDALKCLSKNGFVISRESADFDINKHERTDTDILTVHSVLDERLVLLRKREPKPKPLFIDMSHSSEKFDWLNPLQSAISNEEHVILYAEKDPLNGILGFLNCLRKEPGGEHIKCVFLQDVSAPPFNPDDEFYRSILDKGLAFNVYKGGKWGTYRHLKLKVPYYKAVDNCFANVMVKGDLSSFSWVEAPKRSENVKDPFTEVVHVSLVVIYLTIITLRSLW